MALVEEVGIDREEAMLLMQDDDLLVSYPGGRYGFSGEEALQQRWEARQFAYDLARMIVESSLYNEATKLLTLDLVARTEELCRRAEARLGGAIEPSENSVVRDPVDLMVHPEQQVSFEGREAVAQWWKARAAFWNFWDMVTETDIYNYATQDVVRDALDRAEAQLQRAQARLGEAG
jgi:hypothetical protein